MSRLCVTCHHVERHAIDAALVSGEANRRVASEYGLDEAAIRRHRARHLPVHLTQARDAEEAADADELLSQVRSLYRRAEAIISRAEEAQDDRMALLALAQARPTLELLGRLRGELRPQTVNVQNVFNQVATSLSPDQQAQLLARLSPETRQLLDQ